MRRRFWLWPVLAAAVGGLALPTLSVLAAPKPRLAAAVLVEAVDPIAIVRLPDEVRVRSIGRPVTAVIFTREGDTYRALANVSTHLGCRVERYQETAKLYDVCYGSTWNLSNQPVAGPAPRGLDSYPVTVKDGWLEADLAHPQPGAPSPKVRS